jgi:putative tricarboxylic transport membrane protein
MDYLDTLLRLYGAGWSHVFTPYALLLILGGTAVGIVFGGLPGLSSTSALALFTPLTFGLPPIEAIIFLIAIYNGSVYAGSLSAILVNIPGTPSAVATSLDGYPMANRGEAGRAIGIATLASVLGGAFGLMILMAFSPMVAQLARAFGSWENAMLAFLGLTLISYVSPGSLARGLMGGVIGLLLASIGEDPITAYPRFTGGLAELGGGLHMVVLMIGLFGMSEVFAQTETPLRVAVAQKIGGILSSFQEISTRAAVVARSALIGTIIGVLPGAGPTIASITAYGIAKRLSRESKQYGLGCTEGIWAAESANNASVGGALVPMLTLGIPGDPMTAVLIGALMLHGLAPGPQLFTQHPDFVSSIFISFFFALIFIVFLGLMVARPFAKLLTVPRHIIVAVITLLCVIGAYVLQNSLFDVGIVVFAGLLGWLLKKVDIHPAPIVLGVVLGPMFETNLRRALFISEGSLLPFVTRPISLLMLIVILGVLFGPTIYHKLRRYA